MRRDIGGRSAKGCAVQQQQRSRRQVVAVVSAVAVLGGAAMATALYVRAPDVPRVLPPPAAQEIESAVLAPGIVRMQPWTPADLLDAEPWELFDERHGVAPWREAMPSLRYGRDDAVGDWFVEDAVVRSNPAPCYHIARIVRGVGVDLDQPAADRVAQQIMAWLDPAYFAGVSPPDGLRGCRTRDRSQWGFAIEQVEPVPCALPGSDVRCFRAADWRHDFGERDVWWANLLVFDADTGDQLAVDALHPDVDVDAFNGRIEAALCGAGVTCGGVHWRAGQVYPLADALVVELSPGDIAEVDHGVRLRVARDVIPTQSS